MFKIDSGADVNCIPIKIIKKLKIQLGNEQKDLSVFDYSNKKMLKNTF